MATKARVKATAKTDCNVGLFVDRNQLSLVRVSVEKGEVIERDLIEERTLTGPIAEVLGEECVTVRLSEDSIYLSDLHSRFFDIEVIR